MNHQKSYFIGKIEIEIEIDFYLPQKERITKNIQYKHSNKVNV